MMYNYIIYQEGDSAERWTLPAAHRPPAQVGIFSRPFHRSWASDNTGASTWPCFWPTSFRLLHYYYIRGGYSYTKTKTFSSFFVPDALCITALIRYRCREAKNLSRAQFRFSQIYQGNFYCQSRKVVDYYIITIVYSWWRLLHQEINIFQICFL